MIWHCDAFIVLYVRTFSINYYSLSSLALALGSRDLSSILSRQGCPLQRPWLWSLPRQRAWVWSPRRTSSSMHAFLVMGEASEKCLKEEQDEEWDPFIIETKKTDNIFSLSHSYWTKILLTADFPQLTDVSNTPASEQSRSRNSPGAAITNSPKLYLYLLFFKSKHQSFHRHYYK